MLKSKSKVFKPKGPSRRPQPSREPTPSLKRKDREDDAIPQIPPKRIPTPVPEISASTEEPAIITYRDETSDSLQQQYPSPEISQPDGLENISGATQAIQTSKEPEIAQDVPAVQEPANAVQARRDVPAEILQPVSSDTNEEPLSIIADANQNHAVGFPLADAAMGEQAHYQAPRLGALGDIGTDSTTAQIARVSEIVPLAALKADGTPGGILMDPTKKVVTKKIARRKKVQAAADGDDVRVTTEVQLNRPRRTNKEKGTRTKDKRRKLRDATPEGAELETVDPAILTMSDLCKDLKIGKKFSKHQDIRDRLLAKKLAAGKEKLRQTHPEITPLIGGEGTNPETTEAANKISQIGDAGVIETAQGKSLQMRIVDGQIVIDDRFTQIDRHKEAQDAQGDLEMVEENEFSQITTSGSHMKREKSQAWDFAAMDLFYKGIRTFGTDFEMIAKMFPHRNRRQVKLRYNKEERENPYRLSRALNGERLTVDFQEYEELAREKFQELHEIEAERLALEKEHEEEQAKVAADSAETIREKREAIHANSNTAQRILASVDGEYEGRDGDSAKENREPTTVRSKSREASVAAPGRGKKKGAEKAKQKNKHSSRAGGEEIEIFGDI